MKKPGDTLDRYVVDALIGSGGMGEVYEARDTRLGRKVALKLLRVGSGDDADQRMLREARTAAAFEHPNAVVVYDVGELEAERYIAMELVRGKAMRAFVGDGSVPLARRLRWLADVARALAAAHRAGLVHRDVKPDNVMIRDDGVVKVLDFGIARRSRQIDPSAPTEIEAGAFSTITAEGVVVGTPLYAAPEQLRSEPVDGRADQFAWGVMAYEVLTGAPPWSAGDAVGLLAQILSGEVAGVRTRAPDVPAEVDRVVLRALSKRAEDRFADMDLVADAIEPFAEQAPSTGRLAGGPSSGAIAVAPQKAGGPRGSRRRRALRWGLRIGLGVLSLPGVLIVVALTYGAFAGKLRFDLGKDGGVDAGPLVVGALTCEDAKVEGPLASPALAHALGVGACARLASEIGVDWRGGPESRPLAVSVSPADGGPGAVARLEVGGRTASAAAATPLDAVVGAVSALARSVAAPPMKPADVQAWGAKDEASARRIERVWRRMVLNVAPSDEAAIKEVLAADPESPWPHAFEALTLVNGSDARTAAADRAIARADKLPPARARGLRGLMLYLRSAADRKEALKLLRQSYAEDPDDADIAGLYAAVAISEGAAEEGFGVVDRLYARFPTRSIVPLNNAVMAPADRDLARDAKYLERLRATFPETSAWSTNVTWLVREGRFDEARAALDFARALGMNGATTDSLSVDLQAAEVELAALAPVAARELASKMLGDPQLGVSSRAVGITIASYLLEGRIVDAESALLREMDRQRDSQSPLVAASYGAQLAQLRRVLGRPAPDAERLGAIEAALSSGRELHPAAAASFRAELALARGRAEPRRAKEVGEAALEQIDALASKEDDRRARDRILVVSLPLVRQLRGDREAVKRWLEADHAPIRARCRVALEAALALEAVGDRAAAKQALLMAVDSEGVDVAPLSAVIAMLRLADLARAAHEDAEAARLEGVVARLWAHADPGLRAEVGRMR